MGPPLFLDTSFIIALEDSGDQNHYKAISFWKELKKYPRRFVTTTYVFDEVVTFLKNRINYQKAAEVGTRLFESPSVEIVHIMEEDFETAWKMFLQYKDREFSFTDCLSFLIMERKNLKEALTFDKHFKQMKFTALPS